MSTIPLISSVQSEKSGSMNMSGEIKYRYFFRNGDIAFERGNMFYNPFLYFEC